MARRGGIAFFRPAMASGNLAVGRAAIGRLKIGELEVERLSLPDKP
ncbi:MAG TPA: hypothetical protein VJ989_01885 [Solirubrobacterales bacterium]|nr:hypothetical protein [Solirubrobacterales bacterium]